nr:hypothetical protein [Elizabethkingia sp. ASV34]
MNNYKHFTGNAFDFYKKVFARKRDKITKGVLAGISDEIEILYKSYDDNFDKNSLAVLAKKDFADDVCTHLKDLYKYSAKTFIDLRTELTTTRSGRMVVCQYCTLNKVNTFDHFVPKGEFAEFSVHPKNLLCCCSECNSKKNNKWRDKGKVLFLNLYKDILPVEQYLFVAITNVKTIEAEFYLENKAGIDAGLFKRIEYHYEGLELCERFGESSDAVISSFLSDLRAFEEFPLANKSIEIVKKQIYAEQTAKGANYWESILKLALLGCKDFMDMIK